MSINKIKTNAKTKVGNRNMMRRMEGCKKFACGGSSKMRHSEGMAAALPKSPKKTVK